MKFFNQLILVGTITICNLIPLCGQAKEKTHGIRLIPLHRQAKERKANGISENKIFKHNIQLQLSDTYGVPVPGTQFWVTLNIVKDGPKVTIQLPSINFVTGPFANAPFESPPPPPPPLPPTISGGYLYTSDGFIPRDLRPSNIIYHSWLAAANDGLSLPFSFTQKPSTFPIPPVGYIVSITNAGALVVQGPGSFGNIIPSGPHILLPTEISYLIESKEELKKNRVKRNTVLSTGPTNTTQFTGGEDTAAGTGFRDSHVNDAFDGIAAWTWTDNSMIADKSNNTMNVMVALGKVKDGKLKVGSPIQLTDLPPGTYAWDTAVAINRTNKKNIVVSYAVLNAPSTPYRAVSFDGGKTWPYNGPMNIHPSGPAEAGDNRGVSADKFGNIWYSSTNFKNNAKVEINQPFWAVSADGGVTFELAYTLPLPAKHFIFDYPQYCFGTDEQGNYGLYFTADYGDTLTGDLTPVVGFIPIYGLGSFGTLTQPTNLTTFRNNNQTPVVTASNDGRVWYFGTPSGEVPGLLPNPGTSITTVRMVFKSPGPMDKNYAGPWDFAYLNQLNNFFFLSGTEISQPFFGFLHNSIQSILYDDRLKALYTIVSANFPDNSQNMRLYFRISRDNGQTWSNAIDISTSDFGNRGFQSMALDPVKGDLYFGWYDGRNDPTFKSVEYFATVITAKELKKLVEKIPYSNPLYTLPSAGVPFKSNPAAKK